MPHPQPPTLLLMGGGAQHRLLLAQPPAQPLRRVLVTPERFVPDPHLVTGWLAGRYNWRSSHIDLAALCQQAGAELVYGRVVHLDPDQKLATTDSGHTLRFDLAAINTGLRAPHTTPGVEEYALPVSPLNRFLPGWQQLRAHLGQRQRPSVLGVVGGHAAAVELILAAHQALHNQATAPLELHLIHAGSQLLEGYPQALQLRIAQVLSACNIRVHTRFRVARVEADRILSDHHQLLRLDALLWCPQPSGQAGWHQQSGLALDERGRIAVNGYLQSTSHPWIFASGAIAGEPMPQHPRTNHPALAQAACLRHNLGAQWQGQPLRRVNNRQRGLALLDTGAELAVGHWGRQAWAGKWLARWLRRQQRAWIARWPHP